jgi:hypothetical protein
MLFADDNGAFDITPSYIYTTYNAGNQPTVTVIPGQWIGSVSPAWNSATAYVLKSTVSYLGAYYICLSANTGQTPSPSNSQYWAPVTEIGVVNWGMTRDGSLPGFANAFSSYKVLTNPISTLLTTFDRTNIPFTPSSIRRIGSDNNGQNGRYLICNGVSQGNIAGSPSGFGGEAFLYSAAYNAIITTSSFSIPSNANPLIQPSCAIFAQ